jgi:hypothetical protein
MNCFQTRSKYGKDSLDKMKKLATDKSEKQIQ